MNLPNFENTNILIIGDVMLDSYLLGNAARISPEAPVPVVHVKNSEDRPGGAANVAINISALGGKVKLLGLVGDDKEADLLEKQLNKAKVECYFKRITSLPTIKKIRVIGRNQQLLRLDFEEKFHEVDTALRELQDEYEKLLSEANIVILSDYGKGTLAKAQDLIALAKAFKKPILIDPKSKDFSIYRGATIITPNLGEFELVAGHSRDENELAEKAKTLCKQYDFASILVTRGAQGMSLIGLEQKPLHLSAQAREVYDATGAGDTVIAIIGLALASGCDLEKAVILANTAAGISVSKFGATSVSRAELENALLGAKSSTNNSVLTEQELLRKIKVAKAHGEKIVITNGCFDILHAGHIECLNKAKSFGDKLIVAVNDDASVKRLKGSSRPINPLSFRMALLSELRMVDWVVSFSEDTPLRLIKAIKPDVLVKGGDYKIEDIAGADFVLQNNGIVKIIPLLDGFSSTKLIDLWHEDS